MTFIIYTTDLLRMLITLCVSFYTHKIVSWIVYLEYYIGQYTIEEKRTVFMSCLITYLTDSIKKLFHLGFLQNLFKSNTPIVFMSL